MNEKRIISRKVVFGVTAMASGVTSTLGIYDSLHASGGGFWLAALLGFVTFVLIFFVWDFFTSKMEMASGNQLIFGLAFLPFLLAAIFFLSSWYNAAAIVGPDAQRYHVQKFAMAYEQAVTDAQRKASASAQVAAAVRTETMAFQRDVEEELKHGRLTGMPGRGAVTATLEQVADKLEALTKEVEQAVVINKELLEKASQRLSELLTALDAGQYQVAEIKSKFDELRSSIIELNEGNPAGILKTILPTLRVSLAQADGKSKRTRDRQKKAMATVEKRIGETVLTLANLAEEKTFDATALPEFESITRTQAAMRYMDVYPVNWATAVAIDLFPAVILILVLLFRPAMSSHPLDQMSVRQLREAALLLRELAAEGKKAAPMLHSVKEA